MAHAFDSTRPRSSAARSCVLGAISWNGLFWGATSYLYLCTFCTGEVLGVTIRIVGLWPSVWTPTRC
jgi:hypothetical protein